MTESNPSVLALQNDFFSSPSNLNYCFLFTEQNLECFLKDFSGPVFVHNFDSSSEENREAATYRRNHTWDLFRFTFLYSASPVKI
ncbi:hypothetical protein AYI70_g6723 [Smittium culicis]|uniref:Uncharacterized protein n=1 Tax=Smittium culicis TaxID=133412 RepID=A0A1R1XNP0_9FUNG|nr:hypothetical protein AYI70_g6723 [Smittium culicis]